MRSARDADSAPFRCAQIWSRLLLPCVGGARLDLPADRGLGYSWWNHRLKNVVVKKWFDVCAAITAEQRRRGVLEEELGSSESEESGDEEAGRSNADEYDPGDEVDAGWQQSLRVGNFCQACDSSGNWYEAKVLQQRTKKGQGTEFKMHYKGWKSRYDEWLPKECGRLWPLAKRPPSQVREVREAELKVKEEARRAKQLRREQRQQAKAAAAAAVSGGGAGGAAVENGDSAGSSDEAAAAGEAEEEFLPFSAADYPRDTIVLLMPETETGAMGKVVEVNKADNTMSIRFDSGVVVSGVSCADPWVKPAEADEEVQITKDNPCCQLLK